MRFKYFVYASNDDLLYVGGDRDEAQRTAIEFRPDYTNATGGVHQGTQSRIISFFQGEGEGLKDSIAVSSYRDGKLETGNGV